MKKILSLILAVIMLLGCMSITAFADGNTTDITATVPDITYNIVIPAATALTEENHTDVLLGGDSGKATVEITSHPSDTVNIYYTVDLTAGDLTDGNDHTIAATYTYAQGGDYAAIVSSTSTDPAPTKVTVYTGGKVVDSTIKITANDDQWKAAPSGDYTASIVFNFAKEELLTVKFGSAGDSYVTYGFVDGDGQPVTSIAVPKGTTFSIDACGNTVTFSNGMTVSATGGSIDSFIVNGADKSIEYQDNGVNGTIDSDTVMEFYSC